MSRSLVIGSLHALHAIGLTGREPEAMLAVGSHLQQTAQAHSAFQSAMALHWGDWKKASGGM